MKKIFNDVISYGFIALMVLVLISGLSVLLGFEEPGNIEGGDYHDMTLSFGHAEGHLFGVLLSKAGVMSMEAAWAFVMVTSSAVIFLGLFLMSKKDMKNINGTHPCFSRQ